MATKSRDIEDIEILVHIAAPSTTADDARYRQLARAYLSFEPHGKTKIFTDTRTAPQGEIVEEENEWAPASGQQDLVSARPELEARPSQSFIPESQDLSFNGAIDNRSSPPLRKASPVLPDNIEPSPSKTWESLPSHVSDSYPMPNANLFHTTPARVLEKCFQGYAEATNLQELSSPLVSQGRAPSVELEQEEIVHIPSSIPVPGSEDDWDVSVDQHHVGSGKIIPVTPVAPGGLRRKRRDVFEPYDQTIIEKSFISSSAISHISGSSSQRAESAPPPTTKRAKTGEANVPANLLRSSSDMGPAGVRPTASPSTSVHDLLEIRPPSPPAGVADIEPCDLVSEKLADLARHFSSRYRPKATRQLDPFERGYWLLDCTSWPSDTRVEAWQFLSNYLRNGLAGWGVWCRRDVSFSSMRLYCWGHVAKHTYLLLYLVSSRHIKTKGAEWFSADGELILKVPPAEK